MRTHKGFATFSEAQAAWNTRATHAQELQWANEDVAERKAAMDLHFPDDADQWPLDPSASPSRNNLEFHQRRGE
jgi:hypothetical protein